MAKEDQIIEALGVIKSNIRHIRRRSMRLGRYVNDVLESTVNATLPANYVWVFDPQGDKRVSSPAKNLSTEYGVGMAVIVAYNVDTLEDDVLGVDTILAPMEQGSAAAGLNSPQKPASLSTPVSARDITVGGVFAAAAGGLDVRIGAFWHENGYYTDSTALTLTPTVTSGKKSLAVVGVNRLTNAATYTLTADRSTAFTLIADGKPTSYAVTDIMAVVNAAPEIDWRGAVELKNGDTTINPAKIIPLPWLKAEMVGADGSTAGVAGLVPRPAATDNDKTLLGDGTWAFRHLTSSASTTVTISGGVATIPATTCFVVLAAQTGTADDLDTVTVTGAPRILLFQADSGDTITVKHNAGNIKLNGAADFSLSGDKTLALFWDGTNLADVGAGGGGSGSIDVTDGVTTVTGATGIDFTSGATVTNNAGVAQVALTSGGGNVSTGAAVTIPRLEFDADIEPTSPNAADDEFAGSSLDGDWSWVNQGSASAAVAKSRVLLTVPSTTTGNIRGIFRTYPGQSTWETQITGWSNTPFFSGAGSNYYFGMARRDSGSGRIELFVLAWIPNTATMLILCERFTNTTTYNSTVTLISLGRRMAESMYLRLADDNTNVALSWSLDGVNYTQLTSFARTAFLASADQIGLCIFTQQNGGNVYLQSDWMRRTV